MSPPFRGNQIEEIVFGSKGAPDVTQSGSQRVTG